MIQWIGWERCNQSWVPKENIVEYALEMVKDILYTAR